ncbi:MAG TPA: FliM/FliN family flagellar motor switch protein [Candidatus Sulfotelmatobacter sp.]|nr:FliM/FliN family flagellar motor switch protein [Candidatus Sulfotelmatobacter sp.]
MTITPAVSPPAQFFQIWSDNLSQALAQIGSKPFPCSVFQEAPSEMPASSSTDLWVIANFSGALRGEMSFRLPAASAAPLAQLFMGEAPAPAAGATGEQREAVVELLRQVGGLVSTAIKEVWGETQLHLEASASGPSWPASSSAWVRAEKENATPLWIELHLSAALAAALRPERTEPAPHKPAAALATPSPETENAKLDLLMDIELGVVLRFGARRLLLREVVELTPGSVIELDREVQDPVDVLLDGRIIARGEVVVLDGHYGFRVTEVAPGS